jgi:hypothetical protein
MPIRLDVQVHAEVLGALMRQQRSLVREYPPRRCPLLSVLPRRRSLFAYCARQRKTRQPIVVETAIWTGSAIGLLHCLLALAISTIIKSRRLHLPVDLLLLLALLCGTQFFLIPRTVGLVRGSGGKYLAVSRQRRQQCVCGTAPSDVGVWRWRTL